MCGVVLAPTLALTSLQQWLVSRAIVRSALPVVTGIGHEIDLSIADQVADHHAHTPTQAAQDAVSNWRTAGDAID